jgi:beta-barrel assembly-enhancing protease
MRRVRFVLPVAFLVFASWASLQGCATTGVNQGQVNVVSLEEEWQLGQQLERDLATKLRFVRDSRAQGYLDDLGRRIVRQTEFARLPWKFHLVADPAVNAFSIPGGHVYVNSGLVASARNAAEFAGVVAHETAHGVARHSTEQLTKAHGLNILATLALGNNPSLYEQLLAQIVGTGTMARFSRGAEHEADSLGVRYMQAAGYDPRGMAGMFATLLAQRKQRPGSVERFFSTHPLTEDRIAQVEREIAQLPPASGRLATDDSGFADFKRRASSN